MSTVDTKNNLKATLLLIDVQKDFHVPDGSLAVPNSDKDAGRLVDFIRRNKHKIDRVVATMDSHYKLHIAHPGFWVDGATKTKHPDPFTLISHKDVVDKKWIPDPSAKLDIDVVKDLSWLTGSADLLGSDGKTLQLQKYVEYYTKSLESKGRFVHTIWPEHCIIESDGHTLVDKVREALEEWTESTKNEVEYVRKGQNLLTEMFSAIAAEVPISEDTATNKELIRSLKDDSPSNLLLVCGQAKSHCVNHTLRDIVADWPKERISKIILLNDCTSPVPGFEKEGEIFESDMKKIGVQTIPAEQVWGFWC
mmetsp:Transcript_29746/g.32920  ORF Transcript_29746/g.32920 Transcript_29746/m.32920 type:complete len:308 (-) Transcript_29746:19-942(-)